MSNKKFKDKIFFYDRVEYKITEPKNPDSKIGVHWRRGYLPEKKFQEEMRSGVEEGSIRLNTFQDAPAEDQRVDKYYYNSHLPLSGFNDPEEVRKDADDYISGKTLQNNAPRLKESRRRRRMIERRMKIKKANYEEYRKCIVCKADADKQESAVLQGRCECRVEDGKIPRAFRIHMNCIKEKRITLVDCKSCRGERLLPVSQQKRRDRVSNSPEI